MNLLHLLPLLLLLLPLERSTKVEGDTYCIVDHVEDGPVGVRLSIFHLPPSCYNHNNNNNNIICERRRVPSSPIQHHIQHGNNIPIKNIVSFFLTFSCYSPYLSIFLPFHYLYIVLFELVLICTKGYFLSGNPCFRIIMDISHSVPFPSYGNGLLYPRRRMKEL